MHWIMDKVVRLAGAFFRWAERYEERTIVRDRMHRILSSEVPD